ncbi:hypothetical protein FQZ97_1102490 [compost metagenome]
MVHPVLGDNDTFSGFKRMLFPGAGNPPHGTYVGIVFVLIERSRHIGRIDQAGHTVGICNHELIEVDRFR